ncbi:MAG: hypothetical protein KatS3mg057_2472 [Herpetosiphonaceae bacterium]|nr:MAG: hypothetical protein KatS3mg057_2472 [Herpetosiphonaceae bacterium]
MEAAAKTIEQRVNGLGLSEALVQTAGTNSERIIVELPGIKDPQKAIEALKGRGSLEFIDPQGTPLPEGNAGPVTTKNPHLPVDTGLAQPGAASATEPLTGTGTNHGHPEHYWDADW